MRLLLPPSEAKKPGGRGRPLHERPLDGYLGEARAGTLRALQQLVAGDPAAAAHALLLPPGVADEALIANAAVLDSATTPALRRYSGVVYDGLGFPALSAGAQRVAARSTLIFSGLFGVVRGDEPVPMYRVPAKAVLPGCGTLSTFWRPVLEQVMPDLLGAGLILDLRSTDYAAMWRPPRRDAVDAVVTVRVLSPKPRGGYGVISYPSKHAKGRLVAALAERVAAGGEVRDRADVAAVWCECGGAATGTGPAGQLDLYTG